MSGGTECKEACSFQHDANGITQDMTMIAVAMLCRAAASGGAMYVNSLGVTLTSVTLVWVRDSFFKGNRAGVIQNLTVPQDGGAWSLNGGVNLFTNNSFDRNAAVGTGGAISYAYQCFTGQWWLCSVKICLVLLKLLIPTIMCSGFASIQYNTHVW